VHAAWLIVAVFSLLHAGAAVQRTGPAVGQGGQPDPKSMVRAMEGRYRAARTLQATFLERYRQGHKDIRVESGTVYFSRPGRMRWEYEAPEEKLFLVDGKNVWFYVPADRTATRARIKESDDWHTPFALLAGKDPGSFTRLCARLEVLRADGAGYALRCLPREERRRKEASDLPGPADSPFVEVQLECDADYRLVRVVVREAGAIETEFRFAGWRENPPLAEVLFHFQPPRGVAIIESQAQDSLPQSGPARQRIP
jgi:outer membrane lipoprotein carrier protein